ncbi:MAG: hypothetical protein B7Z60_10150, partial [Ferrovum sp. 37-45-19]
MGAGPGRHGVLDPDLPRPGGRRAKLATPLARLRSDTARRHPPPSLRQHPEHALRRPGPAPIDGSRHGMPGARSLACSLPWGTIGSSGSILDRRRHPHRPNIRRPPHPPMHVIIAAAGRGVGTGPGVWPAPGADEGKAGAVVGRCLNAASRFLRGGVSSPGARLDEADPGSRGATRHDRWTDRTGTHPSPCGV